MMQLRNILRQREMHERCKKISYKPCNKASSNFYVACLYLLSAGWNYCKTEFKKPSDFHEVSLKFYVKGV
jgi:hypothetical protein